MKKLLIVAFSVLLSAAYAQKAISIEDFTTQNTFAQRSVSGINWMNDGKFYTSISENKIWKYDITTGQTAETLVDGTALSPKINIQDYTFSKDEKRILLLTEFESIYRRSFKAEYYIYDLATKSLTKLSKNGKQQYAEFSADASKVAFARGNNLFFVNLSDMSEVQVTSDGKFNSIINGSTDWVYEEEYGFAQAFAWSPDGARLAYYRFDESNVREYNMQKWNKGQLYPDDYRFKYPKAGEANSVVEIWFYDVNAKTKVKAEIGNDKDFYIPRMKWSANANTLALRKMNRLQNQMDLLHVNAATGASTLVLQEKSETYVDVEYTDELTYTADQKNMIVTSERSGYKHLYLYDATGKLINPITTGEWEVTELVGVDEKAKQVYYLSTEGGYLSRTFWSVSFDGKKKTKLSKEIGAHNINMSEDFQFYIDYYSNSTQPLTVSLYKTKGNTLVKVLESNDALKKKLEEYGVTSKEFFTYKSADGVTALDGYFVKPKNFDATKNYPVFVFQYSGPRAPSVNNSFGGGNFYWFQMLAQKGILVAVVDTRGSQFRGEKYVKMTYKQLGKYELEDLLAAAKHLGALDYIDETRIGIHGWSYGGYMTSLVMTKGAGVYKLGIAGAPVTNWRFYDTIYTERLMSTPQLNANGYDDNSPTTHAANLKGKFMLIHGTGDDNVHFQNSVALEDALIRAGKQFRSFYYPDQAHGFRGGVVRQHLSTQMTDFILENL
jgi:Dipeptidyl aminopeptidases/acylaminoacyl-peptidases